MASFLKKTAFNKPETDTAQGPKLGSLGKSPLKTGGLNKGPAAKPLGGSLLKKKAEPQEVELEEVKEEIKEETKPAAKPKLGAKKSLIKKIEEKPLTEEQVQSAQEDMACEAMLGASEEEIIEHQKELEEAAKEEIDVTHCPDEEVKEEPKEEKKTTSKKKTSRRNTKAKQEDKVEQQVLNTVEVDETKRVSLEEMDSIMRPIVAPTTALWEQEKKDVLEALNAIKVEQDMNMSQVKSCLSELDELKFEILPKQHDAETMYDGTKQNYDTVKAIAIANGSGSNAEARKAEGILACQNFVTPSGEVVDLHQYMLLIEERYKFYEKIAEGVNFKKYSLVNYNNAIKAEKEGK